MAEQVRIGVIGTSGWADKAILPMFSHDPRATVAALCGRNRDKAAALAAKFGVPQVYTDYQQMIAQGRLDAVVVATPDETHYEIVMAALDAGLHVLCEKPVALNAQDAQAMRDKAEAAGVKHMVMYTWHWLPPIQRLKALLDEGQLGRLYHGHFQWHTPFWRSTDYHWRIDAAHGTGIVGDLGSHMFHLALWTMGDVASVTAQLGFHVPRSGPNGEPIEAANDSARVLLEFVSGAQATVEVSAVSYLSDWMQPSCAIYGEKGALESGWALNASLSHAKAYVRAGLEGRDPVYVEEVSLNMAEFFEVYPARRQFIDAIVDGAPLSPGLDMGYKVQQVIDAALESHRTGCKVEIAV